MAAVLVRTIAALAALSAGRVDRMPADPTLGLRAYRTCEAGRAQVYGVGTDDLYGLAWELAGAWDCLDDGAMNGSTVPGCDVALLLARTPEMRAYRDRLLAYDARWGTRVTAPLLASECAALAIAEGRAEVTGVFR